VVIAMAEPDTSTRHLNLTPRACEACGSADREELWSHSFVAETPDPSWSFDVRVAQCTRCGFVFASPAPAQRDLESYYSSQYVSWGGQALDYSVDARLAYLRSHVAPGVRVVEVGGAADGLFWSRLGEAFPERTVVQPNAAEKTNARTVSELEPGVSDALLHYYVLEHVRDVSGFLSGCAAALRPGGTMICEVPDLALYPLDPSGLALYEHQNHFTVESLARVAAPAGFRLVDATHALASRPYGFAAAFVCDAPPTHHDPPAPAVVAHARSAVVGGVRVIEEFEQQLVRIGARIDAAAADGACSVLWGANDVLRALIDRCGPLPRDTTIVDSDPGKARLRGLPVVRPETATAALRDAALLVICTHLHAEAILGIATELADDPTLLQRTVVVGAFGSN
jgi:hypothetical protein